MDSRTKKKRKLAFEKERLFSSVAPFRRDYGESEKSFFLFVSLLKKRTPFHSDFLLPFPSSCPICISAVAGARRKDYYSREDLGKRRKTVLFHSIRGTFFGMRDAFFIFFCRRGGGGSKRAFFFRFSKSEAFLPPSPSFFGYHAPPHPPPNSTHSSECGSRTQHPRNKRGRNEDKGGTPKLSLSHQVFVEPPSAA